MARSLGRSPGPYATTPTGGGGHTRSSRGGGGKGYTGGGNTLGGSSAGAQLSNEERRRAAAEAAEARQKNWRQGGAKDPDKVGRPPSSAQLPPLVLGLVDSPLSGLKEQNHQPKGQEKRARAR